MHGSHRLLAALLAIGCAAVLGACGGDKKNDDGKLTHPTKTAPAKGDGVAGYG